MKRERKEEEEEEAGPNEIVIEERIGINLNTQNSRPFTYVNEIANHSEVFSKLNLPPGLKSQLFEAYRGGKTQVAAGTPFTALLQQGNKLNGFDSIQKTGTIAYSHTDSKSNHTSYSKKISKSASTKYSSPSLNSPGNVNLSTPQLLVQKAPTIAHNSNMQHSKRGTKSKEQSNVYPDVYNPPEAGNVNVMYVATGPPSAEITIPISPPIQNSLPVLSNVLIPNGPPSPVAPSDLYVLSGSLSEFLPNSLMETSLGLSQTVTIFPVIPPPPLVPSSTPQRVNQFALEFLNKLKKELDDIPEAYNIFLSLLADYKQNKISLIEMKEKVISLLKGRLTLLKEFDTFLPRESKIDFPRRQPNDSESARLFVKKVKTRFAHQESVYEVFKEILEEYYAPESRKTKKQLRKEISDLFQNHRDLVEEFDDFLQIQDNNEESLSEENQLPFDTMEIEKVYPSRRQFFEGRLKPKRVRKKKENFEEDSEGEIPSRIYSKKKQSFIGGESRRLFSLIKRRLSDKELFENFLKCLNLYSMAIIDPLELALLTQDIFYGHRDLFMEFYIEFFNLDETTLKELLESKEMEEENKFTEISKDNKLEKQSKRKETVNSMDSIFEPYLKWYEEIDTRSCRKCGKSYIELPADYPISSCSGRTEHENSVLNDRWVSKASGSEHSFKHRLGNIYENQLFKCEDDRFELDRVIESNSATIGVLEEVLENLKQHPQQHSMEIMNTLIHPLVIRNISTLYESETPTILDALKINPEVTIPVILQRLRQKDQEWRNSRKEWNKVWREVIERNYYKAFEFASTKDKKLTSKDFLREIQEKKEEKLRLFENFTKQNQNGFNNQESEFVDLTPYQLKYNMFGSTLLFLDIADLLMSCVQDKLNSKKEKNWLKTVNSFFDTIIKPFFDLPNLSEIRKQEEEGESEIDQKIGNGLHQTNVFYTGSAFYILFRYVQIIHEKLCKAKELSMQSLYGKFALPSHENSKNSYKIFKQQLINLIRTVDHEKIRLKNERMQFEEEVYSFFGGQAHFLFNLDKHILQLSKHLLSMMSDQSQIELYSI